VGVRWCVKFGRIGGLSWGLMGFFVLRLWNDRVFIIVEQKNLFNRLRLPIL